MSSDLPRSLYCFTAKSITESRSLGSQSKMFLHNSRVSAAFLGTVFRRWFGLRQRWVFLSSISLASSFIKNNICCSSKRVNSMNHGLKDKGLTVR